MSSGNGKWDIPPLGDRPPESGGFCLGIKDFEVEHDFPGIACEECC